jgi:hypothetical protein
MAAQLRPGHHRAVAYARANGRLPAGGSKAIAPAEK